LSYHLQKHRKVVEAEPQKKKEGTVFTDEDFLKFEQEYFVK
jgi:Active regulator of SIRT1, or 40S ribosomal protein S19-binding 1